LQSNICFLRKDAINTQQQPLFKLIIGPGFGCD